MSLTRRTFLERLGAVGGASAVYLGMEAMGLINAPPASAEPFELPPAQGRSVVILGAGISGLVAAYELGRAGWEVTVLEARDRVAGRVWTVRGGDRIVQNGREDQICGFDDGLYFNAGAARIPTAHQTILGYARRFNVPIEVMVNSNRAARLDFNGRVFTDRELHNDVRGRFSELFAKAIDRGALDQQMSAGERTALRGFLAFYGELNERGDYTPQGRSGFADDPGGYTHGGQFAQQPMTLAQIMEMPAAGLPLMFEEFFDQQSPMFQPVGGMDRIAHAIYGQVRDKVRLNSPITAIRRRGAGVRIHYGPGERVIDADYCLCTLPLTTLQRVANDFSTAKQAAIRDVPYVSAVKVAYQSPRFWEAEGIYGGLGWTDQMNENLIYPSGGWHGDKGVLVTAYSAGWTAPTHGREFAALSHAERDRICRASVERFHPGHARELNRMVTVAWALTPWSEGVGPQSPDWNGNPRGARYAELMRPEGPIFFAGEHLSYVMFWQEGAALSAHEAMRMMTAQAAAQAV